LVVPPGIRESLLGSVDDVVESALDDANNWCFVAKGLVDVQLGS
jgi:hypothetical protein